MSTVKFRASCDRCASDKVKCGKQHPTCARCKQTNRTCVYGISRRPGKAVRSEQLLRRQITPSEVQPAPLSANNGPIASHASQPPECADLDTAWELSTADTPPAILAAHSGSCSPHISQHTPNPGPPETAWGFWTPPDMLLPKIPWQDNFEAMNLITGNDMSICHSISNSSTWPSLTDASSTMQSSRASTPPATPLDVSMRDPVPPSFPDRGKDIAPKGKDRPCCDPSQISEQLCEVLALGKAKSMTLDSLLHKIAAVSSTINVSLRCACAKDCSLFMMLAASAFEILALYQAIADVKDSGPEPSWRSCKQLTLRESDLALGIFRLDEKTCLVVRDQLILSQLHQMRDKWEEYVETLSRDRNTATEGVQLHFAIVNVMIGKLNSTMEVIESRRKEVLRRT